MSENVKISIIMPVFNTAHFVGKAIESVLSQTFTEYELICINSASTDNSLEILKRYATIDSRIKIIDKENASQGADRNYALPFAKGDYIFYLDSDDWISEDALVSMYEKISKEKAEILIFDGFKYFDSQKTYQIYNYTAPIYNLFQTNTFNPLQAKDIIFTLNAFPLKIYKKDFLIENDIKYSDHRFLEDSLFFVKAIICAKKICCLNKKIYYYRIRENSASNCAGKHFKNIADIFKLCEKVIIDAGYEATFMESFINYRIRQTFYYYLKIKSRKEKTIAYPIMKKLFKYIKEKYTTKIIQTEYIDNFELVLQCNYISFDLIRKYKKTICALKTHFT